MRFQKVQIPHLQNRCRDEDLKFLKLNTSNWRIFHSLSAPVTHLTDTILNHLLTDVRFISGICLNYDDENVLFCAGDHVDELNGIGTNSTCHKYDGLKYIKTANTKSQHFRGGFARFKENNALLICKLSKNISFPAQKKATRVQEKLIFALSAGLNATNGEIELYDANKNSWNVVSNYSDYR